MAIIDWWYFKHEQFITAKYMTHRRLFADRLGFGSGFEPFFAGFDAINRHNHIMGLVKRFVEEEMSSMFHDLNYTVVSLTGNRWVAVSIDTV